ncbi:lef5 [Lambdina fiscellaria nucleopolyhedrovirus]|uniref:Lef5 n=1 Tax=Lambdina fiscellaria nucleopolyhedrovirus TaxID=1642929 RepID=A0A0E3URQ6_9ABAC|nr:lef5 [Lambdina fiscellaria nucleopolyhedrovirus]AKC91679.1 lef5 [Lambdina fiscellaria nucleopolyhedrovirus]
MMSNKRTLQTQHDPSATRGRKRRSLCVAAVDNGSAAAAAVAVAIDVVAQSEIAVDSVCNSGASDAIVAMHCYDLFVIFKRFREGNNHKELIDFLVRNFPTNVKNKTFNFVNTHHLFHSLYAYIPAITNVEKERKQIRLSEECIQKLFVNTTNDFKLYTELFNMMRDNNIKEECPCQLLIQRRDEIKVYVDMINEKKFDNKPPKLKKESIDNIMYKYSLNWKNLLLKRKISENCNKNGKKKKIVKKRTILTDDLIYLPTNETDATATTTAMTTATTAVVLVDDDKKHNEMPNKNDNIIFFKKTRNKNAINIKKLHAINGMSLNACQHVYVVQEKQLRAGDEAVSFLRYCNKCLQREQMT